MLVAVRARHEEPALVAQLVYRWIYEALSGPQVVGHTVALGSAASG